MAFDYEVERFCDVGCMIADPLVRPMFLAQNKQNNMSSYLSTALMISTRRFSAARGDPLLFKRVFPYPTVIR